MNYIETCTNELSQNEHILVTNTILDQQNPVNILKIPSPIPSSPWTPPFFVVLTWPHRVILLFLNSLWKETYILCIIFIWIWLMFDLSMFCVCVHFCSCCRLHHCMHILPNNYSFFYRWTFELIYDWLVENISQMIEI